MTSTTLETRLREGALEFLDTFNKSKDGSIFANLIQEVDASLGFFKPSALALPGEPSEFAGTATVHGITTASQSYNTAIYEYTWGIDKNLFMRTDRLARGELSRILRGVVRKWVGHRDRTLTTLLATGETTGGLDGNAIFSNTAYTPDSTITVDNLYGTAVSGSAAEVLKALHEGMALFETMRAVSNDLYHSGTPRVGLMYDPVGQAQERQFVHDALKPMLLNDAYKFEGSEITPMANGYLGGNADMWMFDLDNPEKMFAVGVEQDPDFITNLGGTTDSDVILHRRNLGQTSYAYGTAFSGSPYQGVILNDA